MGMPRLLTDSSSANAGPLTSVVTLKKRRTVSGRSRAGRDLQRQGCADVAMGSTACRASTHAPGVQDSSRS